MSGSSPEPGVGAWVADPAGRHQLRWWDGRGYTAVVADDGVRGVDPMPPTPAAPPSPAQPAPSQPAPSPFRAGPPLTSASPTTPTWDQVPVAGAGPPPAAPGPAGGGGSNRKRWLLVGGVAAGAVVAVLLGASLLGGEILDEDAGGAGTFEGEVGADQLGSHAVSVGPTQVLIATIVPDDDVDVVVGLVVDADEASLFEDLYGGLAAPTEPAAAFDAASADAVDELVQGSGEGDDALVVFRSDVGFAGDEEALLVIAGASVDGSVAVAPFGDAAGGYTIEIERFDLELDEEEAAEAGGAELLRAVIAGQDVPSAAIDLARDLLEVLEELQAEE